jgi:hypothetical protein
MKKTVSPYIATSFLLPANLFTVAQRILVWSRECKTAQYLQQLFGRADPGTR